MSARFENPHSAEERFAMALNLLRFTHANVQFDKPEDAAEQERVLAQVAECVGSYEPLIEAASGKAYRTPAEGIAWRFEAAESLMPENAPSVLNDVTYSDGEENPLESLDTTLAFAVDDWGASRAASWVWGIVCGWDDESMAELAQRHRWSAEAVARLH